MKQTLDLKKVHQTVHTLLDQTDAYLVKAANKEIKANSKGGIQLSTDLVTEADLYVEELLKTRLSNAFPEIGFLTEESSDTIIKDYTWIVDPLDGTANFANHLPIFGTTIALWHHNKPVYAVNSFPLLKERVHAMKNEGICLNGKNFQPHVSPNVQRVMVTKAQVGSNSEKLESLKRLMSVVPQPLNFQSASYHLASLSLGRMDAAVIINLPIWDIACGPIFMEESGMSYQYLGNEPDLRESEVHSQRFLFIAARDEGIVKKILNALKRTNT